MTFAHQKAEPEDASVDKLVKAIQTGKVEIRKAGAA